MSTRTWSEDTLEPFYFLLFYRARCLQRTFSSPCSLILCNIVPYFSACASLLWHFAPGRPEPKTTRSVFSVLYYTNKVSIRLWRWICQASTMSRIYEMLLFDSDRYSAHELEDCSINQPLKGSRFPYSRKVQLYFKGIQVQVSQERNCKDRDKYNVIKQSHFFQMSLNHFGLLIIMD